MPSLGYLEIAAKVGIVLARAGVSREMDSRLRGNDGQVSPRARGRDAPATAGGAGARRAHADLKVGATLRSPAVPTFMSHDLK